MISNIKHGLDVLKENIKNAPETFGVYRMIDANDKVLYIGKAKNIKKRIISYSLIEKLPGRLQRMVSEIHKMEFIVTENEAKALLLENELI
ncbi:MAG: GIY-YIG nuclease family protein, partial [Lactobacillus sp.]|nr:GIY-YIG nuclease family protein [Lactobacillus sp.]